MSVDAAASRNPISPDIYGIANYGLDATFAKEIQVGNVRWGGDGTSRYNWEVDSSNSGFDWYFMGGSGAATAPTPGASVDLMVTTYKQANAQALITIPILPYVNKSFAWSCSFPVSEYGSQTSTNPYVFPVINGIQQTCGNSIATVATNGSTQLVDNNILANHIANTTALQQSWVQHLVSTFGTAANGGVKFYQLDNEPLGWSNTHRDVQPKTATYSAIVQLGQAYASAVKQADKTALILGPSDFTLGGWVGTPSQQGGLWAGQYYLQQMAAYDQANHLRILDYFDEHYYFDTSTPAAQLASTRTLWDPTYNGGTWVEQYDFNGPMQLIPRFRNWITTYYPGTKLSLSEYSIDSGQKSIVDAIAEMDVLGIFGREQLDFANMWNPPAPTDPIAYAFRMFRNYDGNGHAFGDTSISAVSNDQGSLSLYAAQRSSDHAVTILAINKTTASITSEIALANVGLPATAEVYVYSAANMKSIVQAGNVPITGGAVTYTFPSYSAVMFVVQPGLFSTTTALSATPTSVPAGQAVILKATVSPVGGTSVATGSIVFQDGSTAIQSVPLVMGAATLSLSALSVGSHTVTAVYSGDAADLKSTSVSQIITVTAASAPVPSPPTPPPPPSAAADYTLSLSTTAATVTSTQPAALRVTVAPQNGFSAAVSFGCSGLPAGWICSFAPPSLSGGAMQTTTLTVHATATSFNTRSPSGILLAMVSPWTVLLMGIGGHRRRLQHGSGLVLACVLLASCGGDSGGGSSASASQSGTAIATVTVTASGASAPTHTQTFSLSIEGT